MDDWSSFGNLLVIRLDNMGDILMSSPALTALKKSFGCRVTLLTSSLGAPIVPFIPSIDDSIIFNAPWIKSERQPEGDELQRILVDLRRRDFDAAVIFTVFSQSPLPTALMLHQAGIPRVLAYCRENPYGLISHWIPDTEPYSTVKHQVRRDLDLVKHIGAHSEDDGLAITLPQGIWPALKTKIEASGVDLSRPWLIFHPGVSEAKRQYAMDGWIEIGRRLSCNDYTILVTGTSDQEQLKQSISNGVGSRCLAIPPLTLAEFITLVAEAPLVLTVNTVTSHIAASTQTPVIVLYAETNPQHTPWKVSGKVFTFPVSMELRSRNEVVRHVADNFRIEGASPASPIAVSQAVFDMMASFLRQ